MGVLAEIFLSFSGLQERRLFLETAYVRYPQDKESLIGSIPFLMQILFLSDQRPVLYVTI